MMRRALFALLSMAFAGGVTTATRGQSAISAPKRDALKGGVASAPPRATCADVPATSAPTDSARRRARAFAQRGRQAAILGDRTTALALLRQAASLDPTDADLAYELARAEESAGSGAATVNAYCRFLALAPNAPEAIDVRARMRALDDGADGSTVSEPMAAFRAGVAAYEAAKFPQAEAAFDRAIKGEPAWADAYYDRALVLVARGARARAASDLEQYLRLKPEADDRAGVVARIAALRRGLLSPEKAFTLGLVAPGGGQFYTRRPVAGVLSLAGAGAALALALHQRTTTTTVEHTAMDPFGNPYTYATTHRRSERPYALPGVAATGAIAVTGAVEAFRYARRATVGGAAPARVSAWFAPGSGVAVGVTLRATAP